MLNQVSQRRATVQARAFQPSFARSCNRLKLAAVAATEAPVASTSAPSTEAPSFRANLDFKFIKENVELVATNCKNRFSSADPHKVVALYDEFVALKTQADSLRAERNENSNAMKGKLDAEKRAALIARGQQLKDQLAEVEELLTRVESSLHPEGQREPNLTHPDVPLEREEAQVGAQRHFSFPPRDHVTLAEALDLVDFESAAEVTGQKFYYLRNAGALLELALVNYAFNKVVSRGFTPIMTPDLVKASVLEKCGFQPRGTGTQVRVWWGTRRGLLRYREVGGTGIGLEKEEGPCRRDPGRAVKCPACGRGAVTVTGLQSLSLYVYFIGTHGACFLLISPPFFLSAPSSSALHQQLIDIEAEMFEELGLHFKVLDMPSGDLGAPAYRKYDVEAWMPGLQRYGEISSASNCTDYQSRRLNIRYRPAAAAKAAAEADGAASSSGGGKKGGKKGGGGGSGKTEFVHTLNATACAVPRMIVAILENFQQEDGSVVVPPPLRPYLGGMEVIRQPALAAGKA
ncbi:hypothetical protein VOLCADRAFT_82377 [Volvox carteri f. nagariensis]|uniref:serine--tRNA ligase n=1 Tax=Volvox carteri f. nagariensis TaxID=3068 RepID=D8U4L7_VOLCA|nr:uncharacterized protein VOLCADRAFT_82377 [Volvox carteri f. nagariensis]EFJ45296.1 hypothetical protein VOLCADRAFT_82377 [Volvox carteri f. nagariensis]|eukprot:XP_002953672.1 hypothetical protein VOLCADRAFT_82377 [Volvox carteri f. nagariensis]